MASFSQNLKHLRHLKELSQEFLSEELGVTRSRIGSYEENRSNPPIDFLIKVADYFRVPIDMLVRTDLTKTKDINFIELGSKRVLFPIMVNTQNKDMIEIVPEHSTAGYLQGYSDPEYIEDLMKFNLPFLPVGKYRAFPIKGDSMLPQKSGSFIIGEYVESLKDVKDGTTYIIVSKEGMTYKQVFKKGSKSLLLVPYNKKYDSYEISAKNIYELWQFKCSINLEEYNKDELKISSIITMLNSLGVELQSLNKL